MSRVEINADGKHVVVDQDGTDADKLAETALKLWEHAESYRPLGPATGFSSTSSRWTPDVSPLGRSASDRGRPVAPVDAKTEESELNK